jgi:uncharacterized membrane protein YdjX (TVP38/TMEM64 family)
VAEERPPQKGVHRPSLDDFVFEGESTPLLFQKRVVISLVLVFLALVGAYVGATAVFGIPTTIDAEPLRDRVDAVGPFAPAAFIGIMALSVLFAPIPNAPVFATAGLIWGSVLGTVYSMIGLLLGSTLAFYISRRLGRRYVARLVGSRAAARLDHVADTMGGRVIFWSRMLPAINFDWISFIAGMTSVRFPVFIVYSALGMVVPTAVTVVAGDGLGRDFRLTLAAGGVYVGLLGVSALFFWQRRRRWQRARHAALAAAGKGMGNAR